VSLIKERLIDDFVLLINPVAIGEGTSLFKGLTQHVNFTLTKSHTFDSGIIMLTYAQAG
jgi:dihydrofolate reductase